MQAPGSSANLGPGFDVLGLAVARYVWASDEGPGEPCGPDHIARIAYEKAGGSGPIWFDFELEPSRGLGFSGETKAADALGRLIPDDAKTEDEAEWALAATAVDALGRLAQVDAEGREKARTILHEVSDKAVPKGTFKRLLKGSAWPANFLAALATALGQLDDDESLQAIQRLTESKETAVARRAREALKRRQSS